MPRFLKLARREQDVLHKHIRFDGWAADRDSEFGEVFHYQLPPELKAREKVILVTSHGGGYYYLFFLHTARRLLLRVLARQLRQTAVSLGRV